MTPAQSESNDPLLASLPKAELHLHLEGCLTPALLRDLAKQHGEELDAETVDRRYQIASFAQFLELFKWATSYLREPSDYARLATATIRELIAQNCRYAEITLSTGVMLLRKQDGEANFVAIRDAVQTELKRRSASQLRVQWIFDAVRQFGPKKAMQVARIAAQMKSAGVVAFGIGGDEESLPAADFREIFDYASSEGLHRVAHAGEMGGSQSIRDAVEILGAERIGHGIAAICDETVMNMLIERQIPLEICPTSNLCTGALAKLLKIKQPRLEDHPLREFISRGVPVTLATDDPGMFHITLNGAYALAAKKMGLAASHLVSVAEAGFRHAFLSAAEKQAMLHDFREQTKNLHLL